MFLNITDNQNLQYTYIITVGGFFGLRKHSLSKMETRLTRSSLDDSWRISSSPSGMAKIFYPVQL